MMTNKEQGGRITGPQPQSTFRRGVHSFIDERQQGIGALRTEVAACAEPFKAN